MSGVFLLDFFMKCIGFANNLLGLHRSVSIGTMSHLLDLNHSHDINNRSDQTAWLRGRLLLSCWVHCLRNDGPSLSGPRFLWQILIFHVCWIMQFTRWDIRTCISVVLVWTQASRCTLMCLTPPKRRGIIKARLKTTKAGGGVAGGALLICWSTVR